MSFLSEARAWGISRHLREAAAPRARDVAGEDALSTHRRDTARFGCHQGWDFSGCHRALPFCTKPCGWLRSEFPFFTHLPSIPGGFPQHQPGPATSDAPNPCNHIENKLKKTNNKTTHKFQASCSSNSPPGGRGAGKGQGEAPCPSRPPGGARTAPLCGAMKFPAGAAVLRGAARR